MIDLGLGPLGDAHAVVEPNAPPSSYAIASLLLNEPGSFGRVVALTAVRTLFIIPGVWMASQVIPGVKIRGLEHVAVASLISTSITAGMTALYLGKIMTEKQA